MPTHAFWVIVDGTTPTAFRAKQRDVLVPTLKQLQRTQPTVALRWFDRGQLWDSPIAAHDALKARRSLRSDRKPNWRPGGDHVDPRDRFKLTRDQKRAKFKRLRSRNPGSWEGRPGGEAGSAGARAPDTGIPAGGQERKHGGWKPKSPGGWKPKSPGGWKPKGPGGWKPKSPGGWKPKSPGGWKPKSPGGWKSSGSRTSKPGSPGGWKPGGPGRPRGAGRPTGTGENRARSRGPGPRGPKRDR